MENRSFVFLCLLKRGTHKKEVTRSSAAKPRSIALLASCKYWLAQIYTHPYGSDSSLHPRVLFLSLHFASSNFLHGDEAVPIYSSSTHYSYNEAVKILFHYPEDKVCSKHSVRVESNATFVVNLSKLDHADDIKADDCGHWIHNGRKTTKVVVWKSNSVVTRVVSTSKSKKTAPDENSEIYSLIRTMTLIRISRGLFITSMVSIPMYGC